MIELEVTAADLARVRFTSDAVWETTASLTVITHHQHFPLHRHLRPLMPTNPEFDLDLLFELTSTDHWVPDLLGPTPLARPPHPLDQFERVAATDAEVLEADLRTLRVRLPGSRVAAMTGPELAERAAVALAAYWSGVLEPLWERVEAIIGADIAHRSVALAADGLDQALRGLHHDVTPGDGSIALSLGPGRQRLASAGLGIWLVPSVFRWPNIALADQLTPPVVAYPARGAGQLWDEPVESIVGGLPSLIGRSRAAILAELDVPRSTTALAARLALAPGTVSAHLSVLSSAGLLWSRRDGRRVLYGRTELAGVLIALDAAQAR